MYKFIILSVLAFTLPACSLLGNNTKTLTLDLGEVKMDYYSPTSTESETLALEPLPEAFDSESPGTLLVAPGGILGSLDGLESPQLATVSIDDPQQVEEIYRAVQQYLEEEGEGLESNNDFYGIRRYTLDDDQVTLELENLTFRPTTLDFAPIDGDWFKKY